MMTKEKPALASGSVNQYQSGGLVNQSGTYNTAKPASRQQFARPGGDQTAISETARSTNHQIYDLILTAISSPQIRHRQSQQTIPFIFYPGAGSREVISSDVLEFAENYSTQYEVLRRVPRELLHQLQREGKADSIFDLRITPLPSWLLNCFICEFLLRHFSRRELLACPGFVEIKTTAESGIIYKRIEMDISENICRRGFMRPVFKGRLISGLLIYRHYADGRPFILRSRFGGLR